MCGSGAISCSGVKIMMIRSVLNCTSIANFETRVTFYDNSLRVATGYIAESSNYTGYLWSYDRKCNFRGKCVAKFDLFLTFRECFFPLLNAVFQFKALRRSAMSWDCNLNIIEDHGFANI